MLELRSVNSIRKQHTLANGLSAIPSIEWMKSGEDYDKAFAEKVKELKVVDMDIETIVRSSDENVRTAIGNASYVGKDVRVRDIRFPEYLPRGKVQVQRDLINELIKVSKGKKSLARDLNQEMNECVFQGEWEANPIIGIVKIDDNETELKLRNSLGLFSGYLNSSEHEFFKQAINAKLDTIMHYYRMALQDAEFRGEKVKPTLKLGDRIFSYNFEGVLDKIYYSRAMDYMVECRDMWSFLDGNQYTKKYLIRMSDIHPGLKDIPEN
jgi:hypothetical protein